ncbi:hypothetical protein DL93DRAFT_2059522 [Clavulina sp. PMI_390]|nr:hypothetical protein DL93DRAFT_2059522 [Clavulina sp. PMI_390]
MLASALVALLASTAALAAPKGGLAGRVARRAAGAHQSRPIDRIETFNVAASNTSHVSYSSNWSGAVLVANSATYKSVTATFTVPTPSKPSGGSSSTTYSASAWVGIDGDTCGSAILQTGLDFNVKGTSVSYDAWYEWYPDYAYDFSGISFSAGDSVTITVTATSTKAGKAVITNNSTGKTVSKSLTSTAALCETNAEWIVEDFEEGSSLVPLANFGKVTFTGASAGTSSGSVGPSGAEIIDLKQGSTVYTSVSTTSSSVTVTYV